jgi:hypothetical protein
MPETNWGRKETIIWPPHKPIYTLGAVFFAVVLTGLFVYLRFAFALTPLQQFDLPILLKVGDDFAGDACVNILSLAVHGPVL